MCAWLEVGMEGLGAGARDVTNPLSSVLFRMLGHSLALSFLIRQEVDLAGESRGGGGGGLEGGRWGYSSPLSHTKKARCC